MKIFGIKSVSSFCYCRKKSWIEYYIHWAQLLSSNQNVELQNTHIVFFKSPCDVMHFALSAQSSLGLEPVFWHSDATSVPYGLVLIDLSPRTDDRLRFFTNTRSIPSKFNIPDQLKQSKFLDKENTKKITILSKCSNLFPTKAKAFSFSLVQKSLSVSVQVHSKSFQRKPAMHKRNHVTVFRNEVCLLFLERITWKQKGTFWFSEKGLQHKKFINLPSKTISLDMEQLVRDSASVYNNKCLKTQKLTKQELPKHQAEQTSTYQIDSLKEEINKKTVFHCKFSSRQNFVFSSYQPLKVVDFNNGWCGNWSFTVTLCSIAPS